MNNDERNRLIYDLLREERAFVRTLHTALAYALDYQESGESYLARDAIDGIRVMQQRIPKIEKILLALTESPTTEGE